MSTLADAVFAYMNDLATLSFAGYREVKAQSAEEQHAARRRLLQLILDRDNPVPLRAFGRPIMTAGPGGHGTSGALYQWLRCMTSWTGRRGAGRNVSPV